MLRLRRSDHADHWRATLENAATGEVLRFANEADLLRHLFFVLGQQRAPRQEHSNPQDGSGE